MKRLLILFSAVLFLLLATLPAFADGTPIPPLPPQKGGHVVQVVVG